MNREDRNNLAKVRYERAEELLKAVNILLKEDDYKSANNRAWLFSFLWLTLEQTFDIIIKTANICSF